MIEFSIVLVPFVRSPTAPMILLSLAAIVELRTTIVPWTARIPAASFPAMSESTTVTDPANE